MSPLLERGLREGAVQRILDKYNLKAPRAAVAELAALPRMKGKL